MTSLQNTEQTESLQLGPACYAIVIVEYAVVIVLKIPPKSKLKPRLVMTKTRINPYPINKFLV